MNILGYISVLLDSCPSFSFWQNRLHQVLVDDWVLNHILDSGITSKCLVCLDWENDKAINYKVKPLSNPRILFLILNVQLTIVIPNCRDHTISSRNKKVDVLTIPSYHRMLVLDNLICPYWFFNSSFNYINLY